MLSYISPPGCSLISSKVIVVNIAGSKLSSNPFSLAILLAGSNTGLIISDCHLSY